MSNPPSQQSDPIVELENACHREGGKLVVDDVSWRIGGGESWVVLGANGAGKTILLRIVAGWLWPNAGGVVRRLGRPLLDLRELRRSIGWVSSTMIAAIPRHERVLETVVSGKFAQFGLQPTRSDAPRDDDYQRARYQLRQLAASALVDRRFGELSQGEQQKILLARARMADPLLLILDEPCVGLDPGNRERYLETVSLLLREPSRPSLLLVTHHIEEILPDIQQTLVVHEGRILKHGLTAEVLTPSTLKTIYGQKPRELVLRDDRYWPIW